MGPLLQVGLSNCVMALALAAVAASAGRWCRLAGRLGLLVQPGRGAHTPLRAAASPRHPGPRRATAGGRGAGPPPGAVPLPTCVAGAGDDFADAVGRGRRPAVADARGAA